MLSLICIELPNQIGAAIKLGDNDPTYEKIFLALTPHVEYELQKRGIPFCNPEEFYDKDELNAVGIQDIEILQEFCRKLDNLFWQEAPILRELNIKPADLNQYYLKVLINSVSTRAFILKTILKKLEPQRIFCFNTKTERVSRELFFAHESAWSRMIPQAATAFGISFRLINRMTDPSVLDRRIPGEKYSSTQNQFKSLIRRLLGVERAAAIRARLFDWRSKLNNVVIRPSSSIDKTRHSIVVLEKGYSLDPLCKHIVMVGQFNLALWDIQNLSGTSSDHYTTLPNKPLSVISLPGWSHCKGVSFIRDVFVRFGIDCMPVVESRLQRFVDIDIRHMLDSYYKVNNYFSSGPPAAIIASTMADYNCSIVALVAQIHKVPFVVYQHGASGGHVMMDTWINPGEQIGLAKSDYMLCFGDGDVDYLSRFKYAKAKIIPVGSAALDQLKNPISADDKDKLYRQFGLNPRKRTVIYIPPAMDGNIRIIPYTRRSPSIMFEIERALVSVFREFPNIQFIIKLHYANFHPSSPIAKLVNEQKIKNCKVVSVPFSKLVPIADMFILDAPSTSFLEALTTDKPILLCGYEFPWPWSPDWHPSVLKMWQERVQYEEDLAEFLNLLRNDLLKGDFGPVHTDDTLLKLYGTYLDDGRSVFRTHKFLESLSDKNEDFVAASV